MMEGLHAVSPQAIAAKKKYKSSFFKKGVSIALFSGLTYGMYTAFLTMGMKKGVWADWYGDNKAGLSAFVIAYVVAALGNALNDTCSAIWALIYSAVRGKFGDFVRCIKTKPGRMIMLAALFGGPIAGTAYVIALNMAGSIVVPISALCPAIAAILSRILYKQKLKKHMWFGIAICVFASFLIGSTSFAGGIGSSKTIVGIIIAIVAALGWGFEGCVAGYGSAMVDPEIGISIRQVTSGVANLFVLVPVFSILAGNIGLSVNLFTQAVTSGPAMIWFLLSGLMTVVTFSTWYAGNSMCGAGLGTACNGTYSFFGPLFCLLLLGVISGMPGWGLPSVAWIGAVVMMFGIFTISVNPYDFFRKKEEEVQLNDAA